MLHTGVDLAKVSEVPIWRESSRFSELERVVLEYTEAMTHSDREVDDEVFARIRRHFEAVGLVELTGWICLENLYSKFNRSFRIEPMGFCIVHGATT